MYSSYGLAGLLWASDVRALIDLRYDLRLFIVYWAAATPPPERGGETRYDIPVEQTQRQGGYLNPTRSVGAGCGNN